MGLGPGSRVVPALALTMLVFASAPVQAQQAQEDSERGELYIYGYLSARAEKVFDELSVSGTGQTEKNNAPREFSIPSFNIMLQYRLPQDFKFYANLNGADAEEIEVKNAWGEYSPNQSFNARIGKTYRRFGLYNEILDAVPTYIGIEPPELFDKDHLILSRTTFFMLHGGVDVGKGEFRYALSGDNGEGGPSDDNLPLGLDLRYDFGLNNTIGISAYNSNGDTTSDVAVGDGSPRTGVLPWMSADDFKIFGGYFQFSFAKFTVQAEYWKADHDAIRDAADVVTVINGADPVLNQNQLSRFLINPAGPIDVANVDTNGDYEVRTWYLRGGYSIETKAGEFVPYVQWDVYKNPETIQDKTFGGDNEAGLADDGEFAKATLGVVYRPIPDVAIKLDGSTHIQQFNGREESFPEVRLDISFIFGR